MAVLSLCFAPHALLRAVAQPVEDFNRELQRFAQDLIDTMHANQGVGLAAPQVGRSMQMFVASPSKDKGRELVVVNPVVAFAGGRAVLVEGCLSLPNQWERVKRAARVRLTGQDMYGKPLALEAEGLLAIILQHEVDHLQGRLFIDRLSWFRRMVRKKGALLSKNRNVPDR
jgi:peptide deformylase